MRAVPPVRCIRRVSDLIPRLVPIMRHDPARGAAGLRWIERWFLRLALGVSVVAWLALVLAELGRFRVDLWLVLLLAGGPGVAMLVAAWRGAPTPPRLGKLPLTPVVGVGVMILFCGALFFPPREAVVLGNDASVYVNFGRKIATTGALEFEDDLVSHLPADVRAAVFENRTPFDATGRYARFPGGFQIPDIADPTVTAGFSPLFPVLTAVFHELSSVRGALVVAPLFATLSMGGLFLVAAHLGGVRTAWLAATLTLVSMPQIWFAQLPVPEMVAQFFVLAGLLAVLVSLRDRAPRWAIAAGGFLGLAGFAKVDLVVLLAVSLAAWGAWRLLIHRERGDPCVTYLLASFGILLVHNLAHYLIFASHYRPYVESLIRTSSLIVLLRQVGLAPIVTAGLVGLAAAVGIALAMRRAAQDRRRIYGVALASLLVAYAVNYAMTTEGRLGETIGWLSWYVSWPVLILAAVGLVWLISAGLVARADQGTSFALILLGVVSLHYLYDPHEPGVHIWSMRRFVPVVLPLLMVVVAIAVVGVLGRIASGYRSWVAVGASVVLVGLVARPSLAVVGTPVWEGALAQTAQLARMFPDDAVVLMSPGLAGTHLPTSLAYLHDVDTVLVQERNPRPQFIVQAIRAWLARNRAVFFVFSDPDVFSFFAPALALAELRHASVDVLTLEHTRARPPQAAVGSPIRLQVLRVTPNAAAVRTAVDVGNLADDVFFNVRGFYGAERDSTPDAGTFRWSTARAALTIPGGTGITLVVGGGRPEGAPPAELSVWIGDHLAVDRMTVADRLQEITVDTPWISAVRPVELTMQSTVFQPHDFGGSVDDRDLGVKVHRVEFRPGAPGAGAVVSGPGRQDTEARSDVSDRDDRAGENTDGWTPLTAGAPGP